MLARIPECPQDTVIDPRSTKRCRRIIPRGIIPDIIVSPIPLLSKWFTNHVAIDPLCFNNLMCPLAAFTCMSINFNIALLTKLFRWCSYANLFWVDFFLYNSYYIAKVWRVTWRKSCVKLSTSGVLAHLSKMLKWAIAIAPRPSCVVRKLFTFRLKNAAWPDFNKTWHESSLGNGDLKLFKWGINWQGVRGQPPKCPRGP